MRLSLPKLSEFWRGKKVLITGHTGFKGAWMSILLNHLGADISGISLEPESSENLFSSANINSITNSYFCDITDYHSLESLYKTINPDFVFHLAAQSLVLESYKDPLRNHSTNIMGTVNLLEIIKNSSSLEAAVFITTDKVYRMQEWIYPYREDDELGGFDPYSASKAACELLISSYRGSFFNELGIPLASARAGNVIGGGDWSENRLIPDAVKHWNQGHQLQIRRPLSIRPWQHVVEPLVGYLRLAEEISSDIEKAGSYNFGPNSNDALSVKDVIELLRPNFLNAEVSFDKASSKFHESGLLTLDISKSRNILGFEPRWQVEEAINKTAQWYKLHYKGDNSYDLCIDDINNYFDE
ncbi:MAG TPA: CDP-glucose 4,6-dehydratase [Methylophilaceae bacterium]|nr:CDP-glucose 4,6-dehydratase [Methylophilaceae bacterium]